MTVELDRERTLQINNIVTYDYPGQRERTLQSHNIVTYDCRARQGENPAK